MCNQLRSHMPDLVRHLVKGRVAVELAAGRPEQLILVGRIGGGDGLDGTTQIDTLSPRRV